MCRLNLGARAENSPTAGFLCSHKLSSGINTAPHGVKPEAADTDCWQGWAKTHKSLWRNLLRGEPRMLLSPKTGKERLRKKPPRSVPVPLLWKPFPASSLRSTAFAASQCWKVRSFSRIPPSLQCPSLLSSLLQFGCQAFFKYTSLILLCGTSGIRHLRKKRNTVFGSWAAECKDHQGGQTKESLYVFLSFSRHKVAGSSSH